MAVATHVGRGEQSMASLLVEVQTDPRTCRHQDVEELGHNAGAIFIRCIACGSVVIVQSGHRWIIRPTDVQGPLPF